MEIDQLSSTDPIKRALAYNKYKRSSSVLVLDDDAKEIESKASKLAAK